MSLEFQVSVFGYGFIELFGLDFFIGLFGFPCGFLLWNFIFLFELLIVFFLDAFSDVLISAHVGHVNLLRIFFVQEDFSLEEFQAFFFVDGCIDVECLKQEVEELIFVNELIVVVGDLPVDEECPEEVDEDDIDNGIFVDGIINGHKLARFPNVHELEKEPLKLQIIKNLFVVFLQENKIKIRVHQVRVQFLSVEGGIRFINFVAQDQKLEIEGPDIGIWVIQEHLQLPRGMVEELVEEVRIAFGFHEHMLVGGVRELPERSTIFQHLIHSYIKLIKYTQCDCQLKPINNSHSPSPSFSSFLAFLPFRSLFHPMCPAHLKTTQPFQLHSQTIQLFLYFVWRLLP